MTVIALNNKNNTIIIGTQLKYTTIQVNRFARNNFLIWGLKCIIFVSLLISNLFTINIKQLVYIPKLLSSRYQYKQNNTLIIGTYLHQIYKFKILFINYFK